MLFWKEKPAETPAGTAKPEVKPEVKTEPADSLAGTPTEPKKTLKIAVLTSGGDAPGMNAAVRAVVKSAHARKDVNIQVYGVEHGYNGLIEGNFKPMGLRAVSDTLQRGGTKLCTARSKEFETEEGVKKAADNCFNEGINGVVVIGGDGSFRGARDLNNAGIPCVGIPGTIDNDIGCSDYTIGYDTAMNTAMRMVDNLRDTAQSHERCNIVEVMGRHAGYIAVNTAIACGAFATLVPEVEFDIDRDIIGRINSAEGTGKKHFIIVVAEGVGNVDEIARQIKEKTGRDTRTTILGHIQRGGSPSVRDRVAASQMGHHAVELLAEGKGGRIVAMKGEKVVDYEINEALSMKKDFTFDLLEVAHDCSI